MSSLTTIEHHEHISRASNQILLSDKDQQVLIGSCAPGGGEVCYLRLPCLFGGRQAGIASADSPDNLLIALEPEAASIYVRHLRLSQLVPERHTTRAHRDQAPAAGHVIVNGGDGTADPSAVEFHTGARASGLFLHWSLFICTV